MLDLRSFFASLIVSSLGASLFTYFTVTSIKRYLAQCKHLYLHR